MQFTKFTATLLLSLILWGCGTLQENSSVTTPQPYSSSELTSRNAANQPLTEEDANQLMQQFIEAINQEAVKDVLPFLLDRIRSEETAKAAIEDYKTYFNGEDIRGFQLESFEKSPPINQTPTLKLQYRIYTDEGISKNVTIYQDETVRISDEFLHYSYRAKYLLDKFIEQIQVNNPEKLALILNPDDLPYPVDKAKEAIRTYEANVDTETLQYRFEDLEEGTARFLYTLYGAKDGEPIEHPIKVVYGDSLVGLIDSWIPEN